MVDECHRATGNSDVVLALRKMATDGLKFRVLGLSATPGKDRKTIQVRPAMPWILWAAYSIPGFACEILITHKVFLFRSFRVWNGRREIYHVEPPTLAEAC